MITLDTPIYDMNRLGLISARAMNVCRSGGIETLGHLLTIDRLELIKIPKCGKKTIMELDLCRAKYEITLVKDMQPEINGDQELEIAKNKFMRLSPFVSAKLKAWTEWRFSKLRARPKSFFPQLSNINEAIVAIYSVDGIYAQPFNNYGKKTIYDIKTYLKDVKSHFEEVTQDIDITSEEPQITDIEKEIVELGQIYPFLLTKECESIAQYRKNGGITPYLYIIKLYILRSENPRMSIYRDYYGLNATLTRYSINEIGEKNNLSRERVRQIVSQELPLPKSLYEPVKQYLVPLIGNIIAFDSLLWNKIQLENMLKESYSQTAMLVCALLETHIILQIDDKDKRYLVRKSITDNVKIRNVLSTISRKIEIRRTTLEQLDILQYIKSEKKTYHRDVEQLCVIYADFLKRKYSAEIKDNRIIWMYPNALDISNAIENILEQKGEPMSFDELHDAFNQLHPTKAIDSPTKFKPYILQNNNIKPKGKTGIYVLKGWEKHFTGTLTSYLEHILRSFNEPISLNDLVDFALEEFPNTNKKSVYSLIAMDKDGRFIMYEGDYIGLWGNSVLDFGLKERKIINRHTFDTRFSDFKEFVIPFKKF